MTIFCTNEPCETEALYYYVTDKGVRFHLCFTCMEAFRLGQANADKYMYGIDDEPDEDEPDALDTVSGLTWPKEDGDE